MDNYNSALISIVAPCYNEEDNLNEFVKRIDDVFSILEESYELLIVNDASSDSTFEIAIELAKNNHNIKIVNLARNFGHQVTVSAGIDYAKGDAVVLIDADLQDPPEVIEEMIVKWKEGYDVVYGKRRSRKGESFLKLVTAKMFYRLLKMMTDTHIPVDTGDFRLMSRKIVEVFKAMPERHRFIRGMVSWIGFKQTPVLYDRHQRFEGITKYSFIKMFKFAVDAITSFSVLPLRAVALTGALIVIFTSLLGLLIILTRIFFPSYFIPGFSALAFLILIFGGLQLFAIGLIGEYVGRIFSESKQRPLYIIDEVYEYSSTDKDE